MGTGRMRRLEGSDLSSQCVDKTSWAAFDAVSTLCRPCHCRFLFRFSDLLLLLCKHLDAAWPKRVRMQGVPAAYWKSPARHDSTISKLDPFTKTSGCMEPSNPHLQLAVTAHSLHPNSLVPRPAPNLVGWRVESPASPPHALPIEPAPVPTGQHRSWSTWKVETVTWRLTDEKRWV